VGGGLLETGVWAPSQAGDEVRFDFVDTKWQLRQVTVEGSCMTGSVDGVVVAGPREAFVAARVAVAPPFEGSGPAPEREAESRRAE
jgi:hypothetical protein